MGLLQKLGHIEWMIEAFGAKPGEIVVNGLHEDSPKLRRWEGEAGGAPLTFYADSKSEYRGGNAVYLGKAGPQFTGELGEYHCAFYRPRETPAVSLDDPRWTKAAKQARWSSTAPSIPGRCFLFSLRSGLPSKPCRTRWKVSACTPPESRSSSGHPP